MKTIILLFIITSVSIAQWTFIPNSPVRMQSLHFINSHTGFVVGGNILKKTTDQGLNWQQYLFSTSPEFTSISFSNSLTGYAAGQKLYKTENCGVFWDYIGNYNINNIFTIDNYNVWCCGHGGGIRHSTNGGINWIGYSLTTEDMNSVYFIDYNTGAVCGNFRIISTKNGGTEWKVDTINYRAFNAIAFLNNTTGFAGGIHISTQTGIMFKTTNAGDNWFEIQFPLQKILCIFTLDNEHIWVGCQDGYIYFTADLGITWNIQFSGNPNIYEIQMLNQNLGFAVADNGIYKTTNGGIGIRKISENIPKSFSLSQNYPNPFNPVTKIRFQAPLSPPEGRMQIISLVIYDVLGREIKTLFSSPWGRIGGATYEVDFDAHNLSSGVYYYKLIANEFTETKKMVLVR
jgi:photosystem II stability/assembly factor-like uncharacterized protein